MECVVRTAYSALAGAWALFACAAAQEVGIGTTAPQAFLHIDATPSYAAPLLHIQHGTNSYLYVAPNHTVGIGTNNPQERLEVRGGNILIAQSWDNVLETRQGNNFYDLIGTYHGWDSEAVYIAGYYAANSSKATKRIYVGGAPEFFVIDLMNRRMGIRTKNPAVPLHVVGHIWQTLTQQSTLLGVNAGAAMGIPASGSAGNTFIGEAAGNATSSGTRNTAVGAYALYSNTSGSHNTAVGYRALYTNATGSRNTAAGTYALENNTADDNIAVGFQALRDNTTGAVNIAVGHDALRSNTSGDTNIAIGYNALYHNTTGQANIAIGAEALKGEKVVYIGIPPSPIGDYNVAIGAQALYHNRSACHNVAIGYWALIDNNTSSSTFISNPGYYNTAVGAFALENNSSGKYRTAIGYHASTTGSSYRNTTAIGYNAEPNASNRIHVGNTSVSWIGGQVGWTVYSDARIKRNVREDVHGLDFILRLRPVTYQLDIDTQQLILYRTIDTATWEGKYDIERIRFSGFIAQEVEAAAQAVGYDFSGVIPPHHESESGEDLYSLRYAEFVVPLVKAFQELMHRHNRLLEKIAVLEKELAELERNPYSQIP